MSSTHWASLGVRNFYSGILLTNVFWRALCMACFMIRFIHTSYTQLILTEREIHSGIFVCLTDCGWNGALSFENILMCKPHLCVNLPGLRYFSCYFFFHYTPLHCKPRPEERDVWSLKNIKRLFVNVRHLSSCWKWRRNSFLYKTFHP